LPLSVNTVTLSYTLFDITDRSELSVSQIQWLNLPNSALSEEMENIDVYRR
jgi:hypothetical protein